MAAPVSGRRLIATQATECMEARRPLLADLPDNVKVECRKEVIYEDRERVDD